MPVETGLRNLARCVADFSLSPKVRAEKKELREFDAYLKAFVEFRIAFEPLRYRVGSLSAEAPLLIDEQERAGSLRMKNTENDYVFIGTTDLGARFGHKRHVYRDVIHLDRRTNFITSVEGDRLDGLDVKEKDFCIHPFLGTKPKTEAINRATLLLKKARPLEDMRIAAERKKEEQREAEDRDYD